jgi:hypothetical protein
VGTGCPRLLGGRAGRSVVLLPKAERWVLSREVPGAAPLRPKRTGTSQLAGGFALLPHTRAQLVRARLRLRRTAAAWPEGLLRYSESRLWWRWAFSGKSGGSVLDQLWCFMPDQPQTESSIFRKHYRRWHVTKFPKGGMSNCTPGFPTPFGWTYQRSHCHATFTITMQQHHHRSTSVARCASCSHTEEIYRRCDEAHRAVGVA